MSKTRLRCAIYTRKSSEEGLEQDFNSLDAQREACEAYIKSQRHEGWSVIDTRFDDGGFSGGTIQRPALQRLLEHIRDRKIDVVVVYKVDRLTRSLTDFARIVETFDAQGVSFVSVTQQFNTTSSMGRLTLNVLLSFAQFEREVTGERIRDKIAASKKKGMWMGGFVPLGYDAAERTLAINEAEARAVRTLFRLYQDLGCVRRVLEEAAGAGITSKAGATLSAGALYTLLKNPVYIGRIRHKDVTYAGLHPAIIDQRLWDRVQQQLERNRVDRKNGTLARNPSLLAGKLFGENGHAFTPSHAVKKGKRYRYYIERDVKQPPQKGKRIRRTRVSGTEIELLVVGALERFLRSPTEVLDAVGAQDASPDETRRVINAAAHLGDQLRSETAIDHERVRSLLQRVTLGETEVQLRLEPSQLTQHLGNNAPAKDTEPYVIHVPAQLRARGVELRFVIDGPGEFRAPEEDPALIKTIVRAHRWWTMLLSGKAATINEIAAREGTTSRYVRRLIGLAFMDPKLTKDILEGRQPAHLSAERLTREIEMPDLWSQQHAAISRG